MDETEKQEMLWKASFIEKQMQELQQNADFLTKEIAELEQFITYINSISKTSGNEILASVGKGVHVKANLASTDLFVEVGAGVVVKKTPAQTQKVIEQQIAKIKEAKAHVMGRIEANTMALYDMLQKAEHEH